MTEPILFSVDGGLARITLNRPERLNAFDETLAHAWAEVTAEAVSRDDVGAVLLSGAGPAFCAGGDVRAMVEMGSGEALTELAGVINRGILSLVQSRVPVAVAAHGTTVGGGLGILLAGDYAVVGEGSRVGSLYANMGLTPDLSVSAQLARAVGERRALQLVLTPRLLSGAE
ncbi:enoyl-CoA hydratase/isomerase family protein, partial [Schumannella luteola]